MSEEYISLKWGSLKAWRFLNPETLSVFDQWAKLGVSMSAALHKDTDEQKQLILRLIELVDGPIWNDWSGEKMTKEQARTYVLDYGKEED